MEQTPHRFDAHQLDDELYERLSQNLKTLDVTLSEDNISDEEREMIYGFGYTTVKSPKDKELSTPRGPLIMMLDIQYNNGIYILHKENDAYMLEVVKPNDIDKSNLITTITNTMDNLLSQVNVSDLEIYDLTQVYAHLVVNQVIEPLSKHLFPNNELKQKHFIDLYLPRFMANATRYYIGDSTLKEEAVNSEPHAAKLMIEGGPGLVPHPEDGYAEKEKEPNEITDQD